MSTESMKAWLKLLAGIARGERAAIVGRVISQAEARQRMERWLK